MNRKFILLAAVSLFCAYAPFWAGVYVQLFQGGSSYREADLRVKSEDKSEELIYEVDIKPGDSGKSLTLGVVWPIPTIVCAGEILNSSVNAIATDKNTISIFSLPSDITCRELIISFKKTDGYFLVGQISGKAFISDAVVAANYKRIVDFCFKDLRLLLLIVAAMYVAFSLIASKRAYSAKNFEPLERYGVIWGLFLLSSAGVFEIFLPWPAIQGNLPRLNSYLSALAHVGPVIDFLYYRLNKNPPRLWSVLAILSFILFVPDRTLALVAVGLPLSIIALLATFGSKYVGPYRLYSFLLIINFIKLLGGSGINPAVLPHIHLASVFIGLVMADDLLTRIGKFSRISNFINWANWSRLQPRDSKQIIEALSASVELVRANRASLTLSDNGICTQYVVTKDGSGNFESLIQTLEELPPIFAAVITSGEAVWYLSENSDRARNLRKGESSAEGGCFTIIPLKNSRTAVAALGFSGLMAETNPNQIEYHKNLSSMAAKQLEVITEEISDSEKARHNKSLLEASRQLFETDADLGYDQAIADSVQKFFTEQKLQAVFFKYDIKNCIYAPLITTMLSPAQTSLALDLHIPINDSNEHGPFVLGVRNLKPIFVNNLALIRNVLSGRTQKYFMECRSDSVAIIPIIDHLEVDTQSSKVPYVLMIQANEKNAFALEIQSVLCGYRDTIEKFLQLKMSEEISAKQLKMLGEFVPPGVAQKAILGERTRVDAHGYLGCLDIIGSSKVLKLNGDQWFRDFAKNIAERVSTLDPEVKLVSMNWDAFYFHSSRAEKLFEIYEKVSNLFSAGIQNSRSYEIGFRMCITYGDASQDFCESNGFKRWTVVGEAMADVCKFEQEVKVLGKGIYLNAHAIGAIGSLASIANIKVEVGEKYSRILYGEEIQRVA